MNFLISLINNFAQFMFYMKWKFDDGIKKLVTGSENHVGNYHNTIIYHITYYLLNIKYIFLIVSVAIWCVTGCCKKKKVCNISVVD